MIGADYFEKKRGTGVLSTANRKGEITAALYSRPHVLEDGRVAFVMREHLSYHNLQENPNATYLFQEEGTKGVRLYLKLTGEESSTEKIEQFSRRQRSRQKDEQLGPKHLLYFTLEKALPLVGTSLEDIPQA